MPKLVFGRTNSFRPIPILSLGFKFKVWIWHLNISRNKAYILVIWSTALIFNWIISFYEKFSCSNAFFIVGQCEPNEFKCDNKKCVSVVWKCDGQDDCDDGSDERFCQASGTDGQCGSQQFTCRNRQCVPRTFHCDGSPDCMDKSDEIGCSKLNSLRSRHISQNKVEI